MGKHERLLRPLESQAGPLRWQLLGCLAQEYPGHMAGLTNVHVAVDAILTRLEQAGVPAAAMIDGLSYQLHNYPYLAGAVNNWGLSLGLKDPTMFTPEFRAWFAGAAIRCSRHDLAASDPASAVRETVRDEAVIWSVSYEYSSDDPDPEPPQYDPNFLTRSDYLKQVELYMNAIEQWYAKLGAVRASERDEATLSKHLSWLAWMLVEGLSYAQIAECQYRRESEIGPAKQPTRQAVGKALLGTPERPGLAALLGVNLF